VRAHRPAGLRHLTSAWGHDRDLGTTAGLGYADPRPSTAWQSAELDFSLASGERPGTSYVRADAVVQWLDPKPMRDTAGGKRVHIAVVDGCPATDRGISGVRNDASAELTRRLLPDRAPRAALICRYFGGSAGPFTVEWQHVLHGTGAHRLAAEVAKVRLSHLDLDGPISCPMDDGAAAILAFSYPDGSDVDLWVHLAGCGGISNGSIDAGPFSSLPSLESFR
jgi:hypothetical protein